MSTAVATKLTAREYLELERPAEFRSQFIDGVMYPMPGAGLEHITIVGNLSGEIRNQLKGRPARVLSVVMRVAVDLNEFYTYPDVFVFVGRPILLDETHDTLLNPTVIIEVLSPSTQADDRGPKFERYKRLDTLREYVLVAQDRADVERHSRGDGEWSPTVFDGLDATLRLESLGVDIPLREIYARTPLAEGGGHGVRMYGPVAAARRRRGAESC